MREAAWQSIVSNHCEGFHPVVEFDPVRDRLLLMDFTASNKDLDEGIITHTSLFTAYVNKKLAAAGARYGIGGYAEHRTIYSRSGIFGARGEGEGEIDKNTRDVSMSLKEEEPRRLHLGIDIWGRPHSRVMAPLDGIVHSFAFNNRYGDYGATIILSHHLDEQSFYTLYGHLSLNSLKNLQEGDTVKKGDVFTEFGIPFENGQWPPHLHFQVILDLQGYRGDYPGVCKYSERNMYLSNCPDPDAILGMMRYARQGITERS